MIKDVEIDVRPLNINNKDFIEGLVKKKLDLKREKLRAIRIEKKSIDSRKKNPVYRVRCKVYIDEYPEREYTPINYMSVKRGKKVAVVGFGPAGMFAALKLIEKGLKPIIFERGKDVQTRRRDLRAIQQEGVVNPESNYCFGEGGAGTYSDGKLYTRSTKRGDVKRITNILIQHGASEDILVDAHPHIGSNKLPKIVEEVRKTILDNDGQVYFDSKLTDINVEDGKIKSLVINDKEEFEADAVILATGHSARDIYYLLHEKNIRLEAKTFAMGVRIEHPQALIDSVQYHCETRHENLPAASYSLNAQVTDRGIYSFCMCPGGIVIPAATAPGEIVLNGMSVSRRDSAYANSGMVVTVEPEDLGEFGKHGVLAGLEFQKKLEQDAFTAAGETQKAPAQRITDFTALKQSQDLPETSYIPGLTNYPLHELLPPSISKRLSKGLKMFGKRMNGFFTEEAQIIAPESRTSSPVRIPRDKETLMHPEISGLFPAGEGGGFAGGIMSAAIDGENCALKAIEFIEGV